MLGEDSHGLDRTFDCGYLGIAAEEDIGRYRERGAGRRAQIHSTPGEFMAAPTHGCAVVYRHERRGNLGHAGQPVAGHGGNAPVP